MLAIMQVTVLIEAFMRVFRVTGVRSDKQSFSNEAKGEWIW